MQEKDHEMIRSRVQIHVKVTQHQILAQASRNSPEGLVLHNLDSFCSNLDAKCVSANYGAE